MPTLPENIRTYWPIIVTVVVVVFGYGQLSYTVSSLQAGLAEAKQSNAALVAQVEAAVRTNAAMESRLSILANHDQRLTRFEGALEDIQGMKQSLASINSTLLWMQENSRQTNEELKELRREKQSRL